MLCKSFSKTIIFLISFNEIMTTVLLCLTDIVGYFVLKYYQEGTDDL